MVDPVGKRRGICCGDEKGEPIQRDLEMLKDQWLAALSEGVSDYLESEPLDIRAIIQECVELPADVTSAELTCVVERILDKQLFSFLISESASQSNDANWVVRQQRRKEALSPYLNRVLICVFILLPGIHYTIEVDPELERIVHWEWQTT